ncbi:MAG: ribosome small subunit-dependent GTPase A [Clostridiales bacterium]|jgi:ribosome biogenesis GTPase|nr:ribosome small subunit-dependent GTPase A [Clostridiales bacterium]
MKGRIIKGVGGFYYVDAGDSIVECRARGKFRNKQIKPVIGDIVDISTANQTIEAILPRKNELARPLLANIDQLAIVLSVCRPDPDFLLTDKLTVAALEKGIEVVIIANKTDLGSGNGITDAYKHTGFRVLKTCADKKRGICRLKAALKGKTTAFAGNSGVGKSSLLNALGVSVSTGDVSKINRGRHTTRHTELIKIAPNSYVADTPGFSMLDFDKILADAEGDLSDYFPEFEKAAPCEFSDCRHTENSLNCGVLKLVEKGKISKTRYRSYLQLKGGAKT